MVTAALIGGPFAEGLGEAVKDGGLPAGDLIFEVALVSLEEVKVDLVFLESPAPGGHAPHVDRQPHDLILVKLRLIGFFGTGPVALDNFSPLPFDLVDCRNAQLLVLIPCFLELLAQKHFN